MQLVEPEIAERLELTNKERREGMTAMMTTLAAKGSLVTDVHRAVDVIDVLQSLTTFSAFTIGCGWSNEEFKAWAYRSLTQLLEPLPPARARKADAAATRDLSFHTLVAEDPKPTDPSQDRGGPP